MGGDPCKESRTLITLMKLKPFFSFFVLASIKGLAKLFYRENYTWNPSRAEIQFDQVKIIVFLNHTSLYEPLFLSAFPWKTLWRVARHLHIPIADVTMNRPFVGLLFKLLIPKITSVTRKTDESWTNYLNSITPEDLTVIAAEGRMKRPNGLDKYGKKMSVRGGVADLIDRIPDGRMLLCFSGGLHHIQAPGEWLPRVFKTLQMHVIEFDVVEYKKRFSENSRERKLQIVKDLQERLDLSARSLQ